MILFLSIEVIRDPCSLKAFLVLEEDTTDPIETVTTDWTFRIRTIIQRRVFLKKILYDFFSKLQVYYGTTVIFLRL